MNNYKDNLVSIVMGSQSDWPCMKSASIILKELKIQHDSIKNNNSSFRCAN